VTGAVAAVLAGSWRFEGGLTKPVKLAGCPAAEALLADPKGPQRQQLSADGAVELPECTANGNSPESG